MTNLESGWHVCCLRCLISSIFGPGSVWDICHSRECGKVPTISRTLSANFSLWLWFPGGTQWGCISVPWKQGESFKKNPIYLSQQTKIHHSCLGRMDPLMSTSTLFLLHWTILEPSCVRYFSHFLHLGSPILQIWFLIRWIFVNYFESVAAETQNWPHWASVDSFPANWINLKRRLGYILLAFLFIDRKWEIGKWFAAIKVYIFRNFGSTIKYGP